MKIDLVILQFAIIFLPGLIWAGLDSRYALKSKPSEFQFLLRAFLFGFPRSGSTSPFLQSAFLRSLSLLMGLPVSASSTGSPMATLAIPESLGWSAD